jgi:hypothetical protein
MYWLVKIVVLLLGGNRRNGVIRSASMWNVLDCCVVERYLFRAFVFFVLAVTNACDWNLYRCWPEPTHCMPMRIHREHEGVFSSHFRIGRVSSKVMVLFEMFVNPPFSSTCDSRHMLFRRVLRAFCSLAIAMKQLPGCLFMNDTKRKRPYRICSKIAKRSRQELFLLSIVSCTDSTQPRDERHSRFSLIG